VIPGGLEWLKLEFSAVSNHHATILATMYTKLIVDIKEAISLFNVQDWFFFTFTVYSWIKYSVEV